MFDTVNEYCLNRIVRLSETHEVLATEDIYDSSGIKLWAKGKRVSADLQQRLLQRKLAKPLELALSVESAVSPGDVVGSCLEQLDLHPLAKCFVGSQSALALIRSLQKVPLSPSVRLLLTAVREHDTEDYTHNIFTVLLAVGIASRLRVTDHDATMLMLAGLLHDFGLLYVNPELVGRPYYRLEPKEWKHIAVHPMIGQLLVKELTSLPAVVGECIALHHERLDGSGYPNHIDRSRTHRLGAWLAVADSVSGIMGRGGAEAAARISLALRVIPEEYDREAVAAVLQSMRGVEICAGTGDQSCFDRADYERGRLQEALKAIASIATRNPDSSVQTITSALRVTLGNIEKSMRATGVLDARQQLPSGLDDLELLAEMNQITHEVGWRMRNLARNLYLRAETLAGGKMVDEFKEVIDILDGVSGVPSTSELSETSLPEVPNGDGAEMVPAFG